jgi:hypothetical protein
MKRMRGLFWALVWCVLGLATAWAAAALYYDVRVPWLRAPLAVIYGLGMLAVWVRVRRPWKLIVTAAAFALVLAWWLSLRPSNNRDWLPDLAVLPWAEISGNRATLHNIRLCAYRTETDFEVSHYDRDFDLDQLRSLDLYLVYWGSPLIAHTMVSFGFANGDYLCFSIETRKEKGEDYSAVKGLFRQFELTYIVADERDLVRLRTNYRKGEEVYLYRLTTTPGEIRARFLDYARRINELRDRAEWYNAVTANCATSIRVQHDAAQRAPWDWRMLANGKADELLFEHGILDRSLPFAELKRRSHLNERCRAAENDVAFSRRIRAGLPGMNP